MLDRYVSLAMTVVFASFFVLAKDGRVLFYLICLLPMTLYLRPSVLRDVASSWYWRLSLALCGLWIASIAWSTGATLERSYDAARFAVALGIFLTAGIAIARAGRLNQRFLLDAVSLTAGVTALVVLALSWHPAMYWGDGRLVGFGWTSHPGIGGDLYGFAALVALVAALDAPGRRRRFLGLAVFLLCALVVVLSQSRGSVLGLVCGLLALAVFRRPGQVMAAVAALVAVIAAAQVCGGIDLHEWIQRGANHRWAIWTQSVAVIEAHPFVGAGAASPINLERYNSVHNMALSVQYYMGIPGTLLFTGLSFLACVHAAVLARRGETVFIVLLVFGYVIMLTHTQSIIIMLSREWLIFWLPLVLLSGRSIPLRRADA